MLQGMPKAVKIIEIRKENAIVTRYVFDTSFGAKPGQFVNLWVPGHDEKPFSVADDDGKNLTLCIANVGPFTAYLEEKFKVGDRVGIRGPYGTSNRIPKNCNVVTVGGGYGSAPLLFFAKEAVKNGCKVDFVIGARNKDYLLYDTEAAKYDGIKVHVATDDGSAGEKGYCTEIVKKLIGEKRVEFVATCGPELMEYALMKIIDGTGIDADISVERYMKCGFAICGNCCVDGTGEPSCVAGPVMSIEYVKKLTDFGKYHRDHLGNKLYLNKH